MRIEETTNPKPKHGASQREICDKCGSGMRISRRLADPVRGPKYELQTFTCPHCNHLQNRVAASPGAG